MQSVSCTTFDIIALKAFLESLCGFCGSYLGMRRLALDERSQPYSLDGSSDRRRATRSLLRELVLAANSSVGYWRRC